MADATVVGIVAGVLTGGFTGSLSLIGVAITQRTQRENARFTLEYQADQERLRDARALRDGRRERLRAACVPVMGKAATFAGVIHDLASCRDLQTALTAAQGVVGLEEDGPELDLKMTEARVALAAWASAEEGVQAYATNEPPDNWPIPAPVLNHFHKADAEMAEALTQLQRALRSYLADFDAPLSSTRFEHVLERRKHRWWPF